MGARIGTKRYRKAHEWSDLLRRQAGSGETIKEFCAREGVNPETFYKEQCKRRERQVSRAEVGKFIEIPQSSPASQRPPSHRVEIEFSDGMTLRIRG